MEEVTDLVEERIESEQPPKRKFESESPTKSKKDQAKF